MEKSLIVAMADNRAIGKDNALLWHISEDLKYFKKVTLGCPVIMGRKTFGSIGRPLPKRLNIVVSRSVQAPEGSVLSAWLEKAPDRVCLVHSLDEAWTVARNWLDAGKTAIQDHDADLSAQPKEEAFVIGGGEIYRQALDQVGKMYITHVHTCIGEADTFFPEIDPELWEREEASEPMTDPETSWSFEFVTYRRR